MHRAWSSIVEVPYYFSRSFVKFQGHTALKIVEFDPNCVFPDCNSSLNSPTALKCCTKLETAKERCSIVFQGHPSNFKVTRYKTSPILTQIGRFRTIGRSQLSNPSDLPCSRSSIKFQGHTALKIIKFDPNWAFPDSNSSLNSPMVTEWCTKLEVAWKRCHIVFQGDMSNCKVTRLKKLSILTQIGRFWTRTPVWIHQWLWNDAQSLRGALLFFKVIRQISRSHGEKNCRFWPELSVCGL